ncbi:hypothetical protein MNBD_NITROSPINAE02-2035, partial [hydrothermal vent metagenome]
MASKTPLYLTDKTDKTHYWTERGKPYWISKLPAR